MITPKNSAKLTTADLERFLKNNPHGTWDKGISLFFGTEPPQPSRTLEEVIRDELSRERVRSTLRWQRLYDWLLLGTFLTRGQLVSDYHTMQSFTPSKIDRGQLRRLAEVYRKLARGSAPWTPLKTTQRLDSYASFTELFIAALSRRQKFENDLRSAPPELVRSVITLSEHQFAGLEPRRVLAPNSLFSHSRSDISAEQFANGSSYILTTYNRLMGIRSINLRPLGNSSVLPEAFESLIIEALKLFSLDEAEVDIFRAGHSCKRRDAATWLIEPPTEALGRAVELGHIETKMQEIIRHTRMGNEQIARFETFSEYWFKHAGGPLFVFAEKPMRRLRLELPSIHARALGEELLLKDIIFFEEQELLAGTCYELVTRVDDIRAFPITKNLTLWDILIISRTFRLLAYGWNHTLRQERNRNQLPFLNSAFPIVPIDQLYALLTAFGIDQEKARQYVELFTWDVRQRDSYADLQYRPFIRIEGEVIVPLSLHTSSNLFRNVLLTQQRRLSSGTQPDLVTTHLHDAIAEEYDDVAKDVKFRFRGEQSDLDVVFRLGTTLFIFECKNTLNPSSSFEMRASLDQLDKAALQLDRAKRLWNVSEFRSLLENKLGFKLDGVTRVETAVVLSHRLFSGASYHQHPVRHLHSLVHFILAGDSSLSFGEQRYTHRHWLGNKLTDTDLIAFLSDDSPLYNLFWRSQSREEHQIDYGTAHLVRPRFPLDTNVLAKQFGVK